MQRLATTSSDGTGKSNTSLLALKPSNQLIDRGRQTWLEPYAVAVALALALANAARAETVT